MFWTAFFTHYDLRGTSSRKTWTTAGHNRQDDFRKFASAQRHNTVSPIGIIRKICSKTAKLASQAMRKSDNAVAESVAS